MWGTASLLFMIISCGIFIYVLRPVNSLSHEPVKPVSHEIYTQRKQVHTTQDSLYRFRYNKEKFYYQRIQFEMQPYRVQHESNLME